jgi:hypothetical protein
VLNETVHREVAAAITRFILTNGQPERGNAGPGPGRWAR